MCFDKPVVDVKLKKNWRMEFSFCSKIYIHIKQSLYILFFNIGMCKKNVLILVVRKQITIEFSAPKSIQNAKNKEQYDEVVIVVQFFFLFA